MAPENVAVAKRRVEERKQQLWGSTVLSECIHLLEPFRGFKVIRCLALGSPTGEFQALYQLALLALLAVEFKVEQVICYDPVFTEDDILLLTGMSFEVPRGVDDKEGHDEGRSLDEPPVYFMPHAPRTLMEDIIRSKQPRIILGNDPEAAMGSLSLEKYLSQFPMLATLSHLARCKQEPHLPKQENDFIIPKKRKNRRQSKYLYKEPALVYPTDVYFTDVEVRRLPREPDAPYKDSFSDMALSEIIVGVPTEKLSSAGETLPNIGALSISD